MKRCIVSFGVGRSFGIGLKRLEAGARANGFDGRIKLFTAYPGDWPDHETVPYGFKPCAVYWAMGMGYDQALWLDASCAPVKPLNGIWWEAAQEGHVFQSSPWSIGEWCSDACCEYMKVSRERVMGMRPSIWATAMAFDFRNERTRLFVERWRRAMLDRVAFQGAWTNEDAEVSADPRVRGHRHDQTVGTILAYQLGMVFYPSLVMYDHWETLPLEGYEPNLRQPDALCPILSNHNVKAEAPCTTA